ncbi:MAG: GNAT family N-acetyltransferase, partial [Streptosporangiales bacterium]
MASPYPIRPATEDDLLAVSAVHEHAFHTGPPSGLVRERLDARIEYDRTFVASDGSTIVGTTGSYSFR